MGRSVSPITSDVSALAIPFFIRSQKHPYNVIAGIASLQESKRATANKPTEHLNNHRERNNMSKTEQPIELFHLKVLSLLPKLHRPTLQSPVLSSKNLASYILSDGFVISAET
jgi:hypothetical protein